MMRVTVTYIRTSTLLLDLDGTLVVTDPWFSMRMRFLPALKRPGLPLGAVPSPHVVLCSHLHADHFEPAAVKKLAGPHTVVVGPPGTGRRLARGTAGSVEEMGPGERLDVHGLTLESHGVVHTFPPPQENGYRVAMGHLSLFFAGDAAYSEVFAEVGQKSPVDLAILPVGGSLIWGRQTVMGPADALRAGQELGAPLLIPVHQGGDWLPLPPMSRHPGKAGELVELARTAAPSLKVLALGPGQTAVVTKDSPGMPPESMILDD